MGPGCHRAKGLTGTGQWIGHGAQGAAGGDAWTRAIPAGLASGEARQGRGRGERGRRVARRRRPWLEPGRAAGGAVGGASAEPRRA